MNLSFSFKQSSLLVLSALLCGLMGCSSEDETVLAHYSKNAEIKDGKLVDFRDGNKYGVALIGGVYWMTENLRYADSISTKNLKGNSWCYNNDSKECSKNGRLYSWTAALDLDSSRFSMRTNLYKMSFQGICPDGWTVPTSSDWQKLLDYIDRNNGDEGVGTSMKSTDGWDEVDSVDVPTNRFGFNATASGRRNNDGETFMKKGKHAFFWAVDANDEGTAEGWALRHDLDAFQQGFFYKDHGLSVRCISTSASYSSAKLDSSYLEKIPHKYGSLKYEGEKYRTTEIAGLTWMADNMNFEVKGSHCYNGDSDNCKKYGRLYTYAAAKEICPEGWRLPTVAEFTKLADFAKSSASLRSATGWTDKASKGLNFWGFDAKPAGGKENSDYYDLKTSAYFWADDEKQNDDVMSALWINYYNANAEIVNRNSTNEFSVRCVKD